MDEKKTEYAFIYKIIFKTSICFVLCYSCDYKTNMQMLQVLCPRLRHSLCSYVGFLKFLYFLASYTYII